MRIEIKHKSGQREGELLDPDLEGKVFLHENVLKWLEEGNLLDSPEGLKEWQFLPSTIESLTELKEWEISPPIPPVVTAFKPLRGFIEQDGDRIVCFVKSSP